MIPILLSLIPPVVGGILALLCNRVPRIPALAGAAGCIFGALCGLGVVCGMFFQWIPAFSCSIGGVACRFDLLSALFLLPVLIVGPLAALHSLGYMKGHDHGKSGIYWFFFNMTQAAMILVTLMTSAVSFLTAWELMGLMSFALVAFEYKSRAAMRAAWIYLLACHAGAAFLIVMFILGSGNSGLLHLEFILFLLGIAGFGLKAGFPLFHVWLPEAHPAALAPVSAVMSASMINLGLYGILRFVIHENGPLAFYGWTFLWLGLAGAAGGVIFALAQKNLKRLLAYSSIENMGIMCIGLGFGFLGTANTDVVMAAFGFGGAFLHLLNHAVLKGSLFLCAGSVFKSTGLLNMDLLGGLLKRMPWTGTVFTFSSLSISGLPPFNGFLGEFLIYMAAFSGIANGSGALFAMSLASVIVLALVGGFAAGAFTKAVGGVFLGEPRSDAAAKAERPTWSMIIPLLVFLALSFALTMSAPAVCRMTAPLTEHFSRLPQEDIMSQIISISDILAKLGLFACLIFVFFAVVAVFRCMLARGRAEEIRGTWDCGYARPSARMEYTASAFSQPLCDLFTCILHPRKKLERPHGLFPASAEIIVETEDAATRILWKPLFRLIAKISDRIHVIQSGYLHLYILIMVAALIAMLAWGFFFTGESVPPETGQPPASGINLIPEESEVSE